MLFIDNLFAKIVFQIRTGALINLDREQWGLHGNTVSTDRD